MHRQRVRDLLHPLARPHQEPALGRFVIDEYARGRGGYGFNCTITSAFGDSHFLGTIISQSWAAQVSSPTAAKQALTPGTLVAPHTAEAVLRWLSTETVFPAVYALTEADSHLLAPENPPKTGPGAQDYLWKGRVFLMRCPPLHHEAIVTLTIALPREEPLADRDLLAVWQRLAALAVQQHVVDDVLRQGSM